jgi:hypothetical protein
MFGTSVPFKFFLAFCCAITFLYLTTDAYCGYKPGEYYENVRLSEILDTEGFKFGLTREAISAYYNLKDTDPANPLALSNKKLMESFASGFYVAVIDESTNMLMEVSKCLSLAEGAVNEREIIDTFKIKYGLKDDNGQVVSMGRFDSDTLPVMHQGRKIQVLLKPIWIPESKKTALILSVSDQTYEALDCY